MSKKMMGIILFIITGTLSVVLLALGKFITKKYNVDSMDLLCMRGIICLIIFIPFIISCRKEIKPANIVMNFKRDILVIISTALWYYLALRVPMNNATTISFLLPIFSVVGSYFIISEKPNKYVWFGLIIGIIGVIIALKPDFSNANHIIWIYIGLIFNMIVKSGIGIFTKVISNFQSVRNIICNHMIIIGVFYSITLLPFVNFIKVMHALPIIIIFSIVYCLYATCFNYAIFLAGVSVLQPFDFIRLPLTMILSYFIFGEKATLYNIIGGSIVITSYFFLKKVNIKIR